METVFFMFCLTLHNLEEALWLTEWRIKTIPNSRSSPHKANFIFAVLGITTLGYLVAGLFALFPHNQCFQYAFVGFVGAMLINAVAPHLLLTIKYRKYCPGTLTGAFLIIPLHIIILYNVANNHVSIYEITVATLVVGLILLASIPFFESLAKRFLAIDRPL